MKPSSGRYHNQSTVSIYSIADFFSSWRGTLKTTTFILYEVILSKKTTKRSFVLDNQTLDTLEKLALKRGINISELVRELIDKGVSVEGHKQDWC